MVASDSCRMGRMGGGMGVIALVGRARSREMRKAEEKPPRSNSRNRWWVDSSMVARCAEHGNKGATVECKTCLHPNTMYCYAIGQRKKMAFKKTNTKRQIDQQPSQQPNQQINKQTDKQTDKPTDKPIAKPRAKRTDKLITKPAAKLIAKILYLIQN